MDENFYELKLVGGCIFFLLWLHIISRAVSSRLNVYKVLKPESAAIWNCHVVSIVFQLVQAVFNVYILFFNDEVKKDYVFAYPEIYYHVSLVILSYYLYDSACLVALPSYSFRNRWIFHHFVSCVLLMVGCQRRQGAFPSSVFLISAFVHLPKNMRWMMYKSDLITLKSLRMWNITIALSAFFTQILPPIYMILAIAWQRQLTVYSMLFEFMRWQCFAGCLPVYILHAGVQVYLVVRVFREWNGTNKVKRL
uniref:TLC domain-containing protein n=1 Tax=Rhodosorus marinus TaxID=101924 RepID=A0A7S2ZPB5_9RHOD|mmetsp:Transcript_25007/g.98760  ORF Transcript_25007/g.98760 Transcript_25007/m.98760 type:complete len:251 (+) Transcript_25007:466-1218(+)